MSRRCFPLVSYAVQSKGPVLSGLMLDNGPALMASCLDHAGYSPMIFDYNNVNTIGEIKKHGKKGFLDDSVRELDEYIKSNEVGVIGFKLYANGFRDSVQIATELKEKNPYLFVVGWGPHVGWFGKTIYNYHVEGHQNPFDAIGYGDGEPAIVRLADFAYEGHGDLPQIPNLILRNGQKTRRDYADLDEQPFPLYDKEVYRNVGGKMMIPVVEDSRSCANACLFCIHPMIGGRPRQKRVERFAEELDHNRREYGMNVSRLSGPSPSPEYINQLCSNTPEDFRLSAFGYSSRDYDFPSVSDKMIGVFMGVESMDKRMLEDVIKKTTDSGEYLDNVRHMTQEFKDRGVATIVSMIIPFPGETTDSMERSAEFLIDLQPDFVNTLPLGPIPSTPITNRAKRYGDESGIRLCDGFEERFMLYELDLLQPSENWPDPPFQIMFDGEYDGNPFQVTGMFSRRMIENGMLPVSDENVLMTYLYNNGLSSDQQRRREECNNFMMMSRKYLAEGNEKGIRIVVDRINRHQSEGFNEEAI